MASWQIVFVLVYTLTCLECGVSAAKKSGKTRPSKNRDLETEIRINITCDDEMIFYADGVLIGTHYDFWSAAEFSVPVNTRVYAVDGRNTGSHEAGIVGSFSTGEVTTSNWKCTDNYYSGWMDVGFDDSSWPSAYLVARLNEGPWDGIGPHNIDPSAYWIWTSRYDNGDFWVYCRRTKIIYDPCESSPCQNGGKCVATSDPVRTYLCNCPPYYIGANCDKVAFRQIATAECGATCSSSSYQGPGTEYICDHAIDGTLRPGMDWEWASQLNEGVGAWIQIDFGYYYEVSEMMVLQRCSLADKMKFFKLSMSAGPELEGSDFEMPCDFHNANSHLDCDGQYWQRFSLPATLTDHILLTVTDVCVPVPQYVGLREIKIFGNDIPLINVAPASMGSTCTGSSAYNPSDFGCEKAIDGLDAPPSEWLTDNQADDMWIRIDMGRFYLVYAVGLLQRCAAANQNNILDLRFSDGSMETVAMECFTEGEHGLDCDGVYWQNFVLSQAIQSSYVRVDGNSACTSKNNGFREIRIFALKEDDIME